MKRMTLLFILITIPFTFFAQNEEKPMPRTSEELINTKDPGWAVVKEWIELARNKVEILPVDYQKSEEALTRTQVSTRSLMGAIIYETGGLLVDEGWIRILGSGCDEMERSIPSWNKGKTFTEYGETPPYLLIADDAIGGFYALNGGFFGEDKGKVYYNSPDLLGWEPLGIEFSQFLLFCFETDLDKFYKGLRWEGWKEDLKNLDPDHAYTFAPFLFTKEGSDINTISRKVAPVEEVYNFNMEIKSAFK